MHLWIVVLGLLASQGPWTLPEDEQELNTSDAESVRYRGIEQLLAKFEAEAETK
jgi:hypothetical protein